MFRISFKKTRVGKAVYRPDNNNELEGEAFFDDSFNQWVAENNKIGLDIGRIHLHPLMDESTIMDLKDD